MADFYSSFTGSEIDTYLARGRDSVQLTSEQTVSNKQFVNCGTPTKTETATTITITGDAGHVVRWELTGESAATISIPEGINVLVMIGNEGGHSVTWLGVDYWFNEATGAPILDSTKWNAIVFWRFGVETCGVLVGSAQTAT